MMRVWVLVLVAACGPSSEEREAAKQRRAAAEAQAKTPAQEYQGTLDTLAKLHANADHCAQVLEDAATKQLTAGTAPCAIAKTATLRYDKITARKTLAEIPKTRLCSELVKEITEVERKAKLAADREDLHGTYENQTADLEKVYAIALVYTKLTEPELHDPKKFGVDPDAFHGGDVEGTAYLYGLKSGSIECLAPVSAKSSTEIKFPKFDSTDFEFQASQAVDSDFVQAVIASVKAGDSHTVK